MNKHFILLCFVVSLLPTVTRLSPSPFLHALSASSLLGATSYRHANHHLTLHPPHRTIPDMLAVCLYKLKLELCATGITLKAF